MHTSVSCSGWLCITSIGPLCSERCSLIVYACPLLCCGILSSSFWAILSLSFRRIASYAGLRSGATLLMVVLQPFEVYVRGVDGKMYTIVVPSSEPEVCDVEWKVFMIWRNTCNNTSKLYSALGYSLSIGKLQYWRIYWGVRSWKLLCMYSVTGLLIYINKIIIQCDKNIGFDGEALLCQIFLFQYHIASLYTHTVVSPCWTEGPGRGGYSPETGWLPVPVGARKASGRESSWETADPGALQDQGWGYLVSDEDWVLPGDHKPTGKGFLQWILQWQCNMLESKTL